MGSADFKGGKRARALAEVLYLVWVLLGIFAAAGSFCCCWEFLLLLGIFAVAGNFFAAAAAAAAAANFNCC